jgi:HSP20 family protein
MLLVAGLILSIAAAGKVSAQVTPADDSKKSPAFMEKMKHWQNEMSEKFSETFNALRKEDKGGDKSIAMVSVDLREKNDGYILRMHLPDRDLDQVEVTLENNSLSITAPAEGKAAHYQQTLVLTGLAADAKPAIERRKKDNLIIVTIPKSATAAAGDREEPTAESTMESWDRDVLDRMGRMHHEMDRIFKNAFQDFHHMPEHMGMFDEPRFGSSFVVQDDGDQYVIRAYLPERDLKDLKVKVEGKVLKIEAQAETTEEQKDKGAIASYKAAYSQTLTLPGPVLSEKMKVDRKDGMVVVTLPKATAIR